jgi:hypothetical protein
MRISKVRKTNNWILLLAFIFTSNLSSGADDDKNFVCEYKHGSVKQDAKETATGLKTLGEGIHKLKHAVSGLYGEVTHRQMAVVGDPDIVGGVGATVIPAMPDTGGALEVGGYLPPRPKWVNLLIEEIAQFLPLIEEDIDTTIIPETKKVIINPLFADMKTILQDVKTHSQKLNDLVKLQDYDNVAIANECAVIHDDVEKLESIRKNIWHLVKK